PPMRLDPRRLGRPGRHETRSVREAHRQRPVAAADGHLACRRRIGRQPGVATDLLRDGGLARELLCHVLQAGGHVDGIAERGEHDVLAKADVPDDHVTAVDADAVAYWLLAVFGEVAIELL